MKKQSKKNLSIEKALRASVLPVLDENDLKSAQKRVWNELSAEIQNDQKTVEVPRPTFRFHFFRATKYALSFVFIFVLLSASVLGGYYFYLLNNIAPVETAQNQVDKLNNQDLQSIAAARFAELNGVSFEQFKEAVKIETPTQIVTSPQTPKPTNIVKLDEKKAEEIIKTIENKDLNVFYTEKTLEVKNLEVFTKASHVKDLPNNLDYSKPVTLLNWSRLNYSKNIITQENILKKFELQAPNENTVYFGGDYAIQTKFNEQTIQIAGITNEGVQVVNPENEILKRILEDKNAKVKEIINQNNREIFVLELPLISENSNSPNKVVYYLDSKNLSIIREEYFIDSTLIYSVKTVNQKEEKVQNIEQLINNSELQNSNISIKTLELSFNPKTYTIDKSNFSDYSKKYPVFILNKYNNEEIAKFDYVDFDNINTKKYIEYLELVNADSAIKSNLTSTLVNLDKNIISSQKLSENITINSVNLLKTKENNADKTFKLNSQEVVGVLFKSDNSRVLEFTFNNKNYSLIEDSLNSNYQFKLDQDFVLSTLTEQELINFNKYLEEKKSNLPELKTIDIGEINNEEKRILDEYSKNEKLLISKIESAIPNNNLKCGDFYLNEFNAEFLNCLLTLKKGYKISYTKEDSEEIIELYYYPVSLEKKYLDIIKENKYKVLDNTDNFQIIISE